jgi:nitrate reductase alpha subunit
VQGKDLGADGAKPEEVKWHADRTEGKLDCWSRSTFA